MSVKPIVIFGKGLIRNRLVKTAHTVEMIATLPNFVHPGAPGTKRSKNSRAITNG
jgi:hypothetical protein